jgi:hypothetical protein
VAGLESPGRLPVVNVVDVIDNSAWPEDKPDPRRTTCTRSPGTTTPPDISVNVGVSANTPGASAIG